jgi:hypothetical protein
MEASGARKHRASAKARTGVHTKQIKAARRSPLILLAGPRERPE